MGKPNNNKAKISKFIKLKDILKRRVKIYIGSPENKTKEVKRETTFGILEILSWI